MAKSCPVSGTYSSCRGLRLNIDHILVAAAWTCSPWEVEQLLLRRHSGTLAQPRISIPVPLSGVGAVIPLAEGVGVYLAARIRPTYFRGIRPQQGEPILARHLNLSVDKTKGIHS
jgi:hypothetical protein